MGAVAAHLSLSDLMLLIDFASLYMPLPVKSQAGMAALIR